MKNILFSQRKERDRLLSQPYLTRQMWKVYPGFADASE